MSSPPASPPAETAAPESTPRGGRGVAALAVLGVVALALLLLAAARPSASSHRDIDEPGYSYGGLYLAEGYSPAYRAAPAGPLTWAGWAWVNGQAALRLAGVGDAAAVREIRSSLVALKPYVAVNGVLFDAYRDGRPLRGFLLGCGFVVWTAGAAAAAGLGWRHARLPGALLTGGLWASLPLFVDLATQTRPYAWAWAFAALAVWFADRSRGRGGDVLCAIAYGLSVGSRIEMLALAPLLLCFFYRPGHGFRRFARRAGGLALGSAAATLVVAPWLVTSLLSNLKSILAVYVMRVMVSQSGLDGAGTGGGEFLDVLWWQGLGPTIVFVLLGLGVAALRRGPTVGRGRSLVLLVLAAGASIGALYRTGAGLHHSGWAVVLLVLCAAPAAGSLRLWWDRRGRPAAGWLPGALVGIIVGLPLAQTLVALPTIRPPYRADAQAIAWLEANVPQGTTVYKPQMLVSPLPTAESARRQWAWYNDVGWRRKLAWGLGRVELLEGDETAADDVALAGLPPAVADDTAIKERLSFRQLLILGSRPDVTASRFDVRLLSMVMTLGEDRLSANPATNPSAAAIRIQVGPPLPEYGTPLASWTDAAGDGTYIYRAGSGAKPR